MRYKNVSFRTQCRAPKRYATLDGAHEAEGYTITRNGDDVVVHHYEFAGEVLVVPWANVAFAIASEEELTRPEAKKR